MHAVADGRLLAAQHSRRFENGLHGLEVAGTAAQNSRDSLPDFLIRWSRLPVKEGLGRQDLCWSAVAALNRAVLDKRLLDGMQPLGVTPALLRDALPRASIVAIL